MDASEDPSLDASHDTSRDNGGDIAAAFEATLTAIREAHAAEVVALREQMTAGDAYAKQAEARAMRAEEAVGAERVRADALRDRLESAQAELRRAQEAAELLRAAEAERRARGRIRRAWEAWRGR